MYTCAACALCAVCRAKEVIVCEYVDANMNGMMPHFEYDRWPGETTPETHAQRTKLKRSRALAPHAVLCRV